MTPEEKLRQLMSRAHAPDDMWEPAIQILNEAVTLETERCAKVAEELGLTFHVASEPGLAPRIDGSLIAAAIRRN